MESRLLIKLFFIMDIECTDNIGGHMFLLHLDYLRNLFPFSKILPLYRRRYIGTINKKRTITNLLKFIEVSTDVFPFFWCLAENSQNKKMLNLL